MTALQDLTLKDFFPAEPGKELVDRFKAHVAETGTPETFPDLSTTPPPKSGALRVLHNPVNLNRKLREGGLEAPCPICSPRHAKWLYNGTLIWCEDTRAIYVIGPDCYKSWFGRGRFDIELNRLRESQEALADAAALFDLQQIAPDLLTWVKDHRQAARAAEQAQADLRKSAPKLRAALARELKSRLAGRGEGLGFLTGGWALTKDLDAAETALTLQVGLTAAERLAKIESLSPTARAVGVAQLRAALDLIRKTSTRLAQAAAFTSDSNLTGLAATFRPGQGVGIPVVSLPTATRVEMRLREELWRGPRRLILPRDVPGLPTSRQNAR